MTKTCPQCAMVLSFETARLPTEPFTVMCPRCRQSVTIMPPEQEEGRLPGAPGTGPIAAGDSGKEAELLRSLAALLRGGNGGEAQAATGDKWQRRRVLVCIDDKAIRDKVRAILDHSRYEIFSAELATEASEILQEYRAEAIILSPTFDAEHAGGGAIMQHVNRLTPQMRRRTYVVLVSPQLRTMDTYLAFANGVNLSIHPEDVGSLQAILERSIRDFNELYRPLYTAMEIQPF
ncbi:MAG TPA: hypothetical protein VLZ81_16085 [Blastocatellia bacterium]|nr:hypothetical protein [Blastocatellia bacterium]